MNNGTRSSAAASSGSGGAPAAHGTLLRLEQHPLSTAHGVFETHVFHNIETQRYAIALTLGQVDDPAPLLTRVHSSCVTSEAFGACDCDCAGQLDVALRTIRAEGRGAVFYLLQEGRGAGFLAKARDRMIVQSSRHRMTTFEAYEQMGLGGDHRRYDEVAFACRMLSVRAPLRLLTNNPEKVAALESEKLVIESTVPLHEQVSPFNLHYLASKSRSGHALGDPSQRDCAADLPEVVRYFDPYLLDDAPRFLHVASYLLPVRLPPAASIPSVPTEPHWFWLHLHFDRRERKERVVLTSRRDPDAEPLVRVHNERLLDRFLGRHGCSEWLATVRDIADRGAGCVAFLPTTLGGRPDAAAAAPDRAAEQLLAHHLRALAPG